jgi:hypothetical protein
MNDIVSSKDLLCSTCANRIFPESSEDTGKNGTDVKCEEYHWIAPTKQCSLYIRKVIEWNKYQN